jgi:hypothetical protein
MAAIGGNITDLRHAADPGSTDLRLRPNWANWHASWDETRSRVLPLRDGHAIKQRFIEALNSV